MRAVCRIPVQVYDADLAGIYQPGDALTGEKARLALERYPQYFEAEKPAKGGKDAKVN